MFGSMARAVTPRPYGPWLVQRVVPPCTVGAPTTMNTTQASAAHTHVSHTCNMSAADWFIVPTSVRLADALRIIAAERPARFASHGRVRGPTAPRVERSSRKNGRCVERNISAADRRLLGLACSVPHAGGSTVRRAPEKITT